MSFIIFTNIKECIILTSFVNIVLSSPDLVYLNALLHILNNFIFFIKKNKSQNQWWHCSGYDTALMSCLQM